MAQFYIDIRKLKSPQEKVTLTDAEVISAIKPLLDKDAVVLAANQDAQILLVDRPTHNFGYEGFSYDVVTYGRSGATFVAIKALGIKHHLPHMLEVLFPDHYQNGTPKDFPLLPTVAA